MPKWPPAEWGRRLHKSAECLAPHSNRGAAAALALALVLGVALIAHPARAALAAQTGLTLTARAGFDGYYKADHWMPVHVVVANEGQDVEGQIELQARDGLSNQVVYTQPAILPTHSRKQFTLYVLVEGYTRELSVRLVQDARKGASQRRTVAETAVGIQPLDAQSFLCAVVSDDLSALNYLAGLPPMGQRRIHVSHLRLSDLPTQGRALEGLDVLILHNTDTALMGDRLRDALRGWVAFGGHLIICGGPNAVPTAAGLGDLLPVVVNGTLTTDDIGSLGEYVNTPFLVNVPAVVAQVEPVRDELPVARDGEFVARVLAGKEELPLLIRRDVDRGHIDYLALDPDLEPLRTWIGNEQLWSRLFIPTATADTQLNQSSIASALYNIPNLDVPPVSLVAAFLAAYVVVIGPLNFFLLKRADRRALAWITVPAIVFAFTCVAYIAGFASRGRRVIVNQITIIRPQLESGTAAVDSFMGLYSPTRRSYDVQVPDNVLVRKLSYSSFGPGGNDREPLIVELGPPTYVRQFEVDVGAMRNFATHSTQPWHDIEAQLTVGSSSRGSDQVHIKGTISNRGNLDIEDCALVWRGNPIRIADLPAGATQHIALDFRKPSQTSMSQSVQGILGAVPAGNQERRERVRRQEILQSVFAPAVLSRSGPVMPQEVPTGLTLVGWLSQSPVQIAVTGQKASRGLLRRREMTTMNATTLLVAPLTTLSGDPNTLLVSERSIPWRATGEDQTLSPYALDTGDVAALFEFQLPVAGRGTSFTVDELFVHIGTLYPAPVATPPVLYLMNVTTGKWVPFPSLSWGATSLSDPQRFVQEDGTIEVKIATNTIENPVSVDFSATIRIE